MNRRSFIRGAAALLAYLGCSCAPITYEIAKDQPDRRQEYIDEMVRKLVRYGITSISVNPDAINRVRKIIAETEDNL